MEVIYNAWKTRFCVFHKEKNKITYSALGIEGKRITKWFRDVYAPNNHYFFADDGKKHSLYKFDNKVSKVRDIDDDLYTDEEHDVYILIRSNNIKVYSYPDILMFSIDYDFKDFIDTYINLLKKPDILLVEGLYGEKYIHHLLLIEDNKVKSEVREDRPVLDIAVQCDVIVLRSIHFLDIYDFNLKKLKTIYGDIRPFLEAHGWDKKTNNMEGVISKALSVEGKEIDVKTLM